MLYEERKSKDRQSESTGTINQAEALATKVKPKWKRRVHCHNCGKLGHFQKNCYAAERQQAGFKMKKSERFKKGQSSKNNVSVGLLASTHAALAAERNEDSRVNWIIYSGATCHICCNKSMFLEVEMLETPEIVTLGDGRCIEAFEKGTVEVKLEQADGSYRTGTLFDALYVPELAYNLLSIAN